MPWFFYKSQFSGIDLLKNSYEKINTKSFFSGTTKIQVSFLKFIQITFPQKHKQKTPPKPKPTNENTNKPRHPESISVLICVATFKKWIILVSMKWCELLGPQAMCISQPKYTHQRTAPCHVIVHTACVPWHSFIPGYLAVFHTMPQNNPGALPRVEHGWMQLILAKEG